MRDTTMTLKRNNTTMLTGIQVQIQNMSWQTAADMGGESPYDSFWIRTTGGGILDVRRQDLLIDEHETNPLTNAATQYRVFGNPQQYYQAYARIPAQKILTK